MAPVSWVEREAGGPSAAGLNGCVRARVIAVACIECGEAGYRRGIVVL